MIIQQMHDTYDIRWSENEQGFMYDIYANRILNEEQINSGEFESDDGGCCTGSLADTFEMAGINIYL